MTDRDFAWVRDFLRASAGLSLDEDKAYLARYRLEPIARREGFASLSALISHLAIAKRNGLHARVLEAMTTNETSFFRDPPLFEALRSRILPALLDARRPERRLVAWSAACSSGQEIYSLAMLLNDDLSPALSGWQVELLGSDLSASMIERARAGLYSQLEVNRGLPATRLLGYFDKEGLGWRLRPELRRAVDFRVLNLLDSWSGLPAPDLLLLRNLLIYLGDDVRRALLRKVHGFLRPGGLLVLGASESLLGCEDAFERLDFGTCSAYRPLLRERMAP